MAYKSKFTEQLTQKNDTDFVKAIKSGDIENYYLQKRQEQEQKETTKKRTWLQSGVFSDGYQFGDVTKSILGTAADTEYEIIKGVYKTGENILDGGVTLFGFGTEKLGQVLNDDDMVNFSNGLKSFVKRDLTEESGAATMVTNNSAIGGLNNLVNGNFENLPVVDSVRTISGVYNNTKKNGFKLSNLGDTQTKSTEKINQQSFLGEKTGGVLQSGGQLGTQILLQSVGVPWQLTAGASAFGSEAENAFNKDASYNEAMFSSSVSAGAEILSETLFKIPGLEGTGSGKFSKTLIQKATDKFESTMAKNLVNLGVNAMGEGSEEIISSLFQNLGQALSYENEATLEELINDPKKRDAFVKQVIEKEFGKEAIEEYKESFIGGALLGAAGGSVQTYQATKAGRDINTGLTQNEQTILDEETQNRINEAEKDGKKLTKKEKIEIEQQVDKDLRNGFISTDVIESKLGGEEYQNYKKAIENIKNIEDDISKINSKKMTELSVGEYNDATSKIKALREQINQIDTNTLKSKLDSKINEIISSDDYLQMSYQEKYNKSQKFQADISKYDGKAKETIQNAIDSGILNNTRKTHNFVDMVTKISADKGISFDFTNNQNLKESSFALENKQINGFVNKKGITINIDSNQALQKVVGHEVTHILEGTELYNQLQTELENYIGKEKWNQKLNELSELYKDVENSNIKNELTSDLIGEYLFTDSEFINNLSAKKPNIFRKIYNEIKYLCKIATTGSKEARQLEKIKKKFEEAYQASKQNSEINDNKLMLSNIENNANLEYNNFTEDERINIAVEKDSRKKPYVKHGHCADFMELDFDRMKKAINFGSKPALEAQRYELDFFSYNDDKYIYSADIIDKYNNYFKISNVEHIKGDVGEYVEERISKQNNGLFNRNGLNEGSDDNYIESNRNRETSDGFNRLDKAKQTIELDGNKQSSKENSKDVKNTSFSSDTKYSLSTDNQGRELSKGQQEYFKDSKARDENGNLQVYYNGSGEHTEYLPGYMSDDSIWGKGIYLSPYKEVASNYGSDVKEAYVNITNPIGNEKNLTFEQYNEFVKAISDGEEAYIEDYDMYDNDFDLLWDATNKGNWADYADELLEYTGYDGLIINPEEAVEGDDFGQDEMVIAFKSNQIKNVDNINPTSNNDIRMSLSNKSDIAPINNNLTYGKDIKLDKQIAPIKDTNNLSTKIDELSNKFGITEEPKVNNNIAPVKEKITENVIKDDVDIEQQEAAKVLSEKPTPKNREQRLAATAIINLADKGYYISKLARETNNRQLDALYDNTLLSNAQAQEIIGEGRYKFDEKSKTYEKVGDSIYEIYEAIETSNKKQLFDEYMYHKLNTERMSLESKGEKNKPVFGESVTADMSKKIVSDIENNNPEFIDYAKRIYEYESGENSDLSTLVESGILSQEDAEYYKDKYKNYVPIIRDLEQLEYTMFGKKRVGTKNPIKSTKGGNQNIIPLKDAMAIKTMLVQRSANMNKLGLELMKTLSTNVIEEQVTTDKIIEDISNNKDLIKAGTNGKAPTMTVYENGVKKTFEIPDEIYQALKPNYDSVLKNITIKPLNAYSNYKRKVLTQYNPFFMVTNAIKDAQDVLINSQHPLQTYKNFPEAIAQLKQKGYWYKEMQQQGLFQDTYYDNKEGFNIKKSKIENFFPLRKISEINDFIERVPRMAEYIASRKNGATIEVASLDSARVTTNFKAGGDITKALNRNGFTFLNASVQGAVQQIRNVQEAHQQGMKGYIKLATKFSMAALPALILNNLIWDDDDDYAQLSDYIKDNYYIIGKYGDGQVIKIPKGRMTAVIQDGLEQMQNLITGNDKVDLDNFTNLVINNLAPNNPIENNVLSPFIQTDLFGNSPGKTWYGGDLVPTRLQNKPAAEQYDESTSELSKWLGKTFNVSPIKLDNLIDQNTGVIGDLVLPMMTAEAKTKNSNPIMAAIEDKFTADVVFDNKNSSNFYKTKGELTVKANSYKATDREKLQNKYMNSVQADMNSIYSQIRDVQNSNLKQSEKYAQVRELRKQINEKSQEALNNYENVKISNNYASVGNKEYYKNNKNEWTSIPSNEREALNTLEMTQQQKNSYFTAKNEISNIINENSSTRKSDIINVVKNSDLDDSQKAYLYDKYYASTDKLNVITKLDIDFNTYLDIEDQEFTSDKDSKGNSIKGSKKEKIIDYVNNIDADYGTRIILYKIKNMTDNEYNSDIVDYLNEREDVTYDDMKTILESLGMKVDNKGNITW